MTLKKGHEEYLLFGVWAFNHLAKICKRIEGQVIDALNDCAALLPGKEVIVIGDFNHNVVFRDKPKFSFMKTVRYLEQQQLVSVYHKQSGEEFGKESRTTHYWQKRTKEARQFHIDYAFASQSVFERGCHLEIGSFEDYIGPSFSDHLPLVLDLF